MTSKELYELAKDIRTYYIGGTIDENSLGLRMSLWKRKPNDPFIINDAFINNNLLYIQYETSYTKQGFYIDTSYNIKKFDNDIAIKDKDGITRYTLIAGLQGERMMKLNETLN